ncbi:MAG: DUF2786 domain-containing protein [Kofleriaceae bacterium]|nr:DUF2786 domain-containing protein [Kofleriaceae bacterium]MBP9169218.1 DUF2786 domain-containing protein [Kofleriaceae bacterium]MBP9859123.1 DUF2786 domain-containing protein [Kofleriaceae bacterium]
MQQAFPWASAAPPRADAPATDASRVEAPRVEAPRVEAPRVEASVTEASVTEAPGTEAPPPLAQLTADLEAALLRELARCFDWENHARFGKRLRPPTLALSDTATRLGQWVRATRTLELSRPLVVARPWPEVVSVLLHEMAHQYVDEVLAVRGEDAHGPTFQRVCAERGIDARAHGAPVPEDGDRAAGDRVLERIRKLLALAGSANQHEAEAAMRTAHGLMLRYNVDGVGQRHAYQVRHVGDPTARRSTAEGMIAVLLAEFFFVRVIQIPVYLPALGRHGQVFELTGTAANLDMAEHVFEFLRATAERLWHANRADARIRSGHDRARYQAGVIAGFHDKLRAERTELRGTGLIWVGDADLDEHYHRRNPRITRRRKRVRADGAHAAGREAGQRVVLHRPLTRGPSGGGPKLLG